MYNNNILEGQSPIIALPTLVGVDELAKICNVKPSTIYYWKSRGIITPAIDTGRVLRFDLAKTLSELSQQRDSESCQPKEKSLDLINFSRSLKTRGRNFASSEKGDGNGTH